jgi:hypothetical protein
MGNTVKRVLIAIKVDPFVQSRQCPVVHTRMHIVRLGRPLNFHKAVLDQCSHNALQVNQFTCRIKKPTW